MAYRFVHVPLIAFITGAIFGCGVSAPARFYTLNSTAMAEGAPRADYAVLVGPVSVPSAVDRPQFVIQVAPNRVELDEFNRWAAPLNDSIARAVAGDLSVILGTPHVAAAPVANFDPNYRVTIDVQRFESIPGEAVVIDAAWAVRTVAGGATQTGRTVARETVRDGGFDELAAAHSRALGRLSSDIAAAVRAAAEETSSAQSSVKGAER